MTREEAIQKIQNDLKLHHDYLSGDYRRALRIAISALQQPEIIRCKDCKFAINADTDMMCGNPKSWVVATENDFGCILAERREQ